ncbi:MAG: hypothetical protein WC144_05105 [Sulfurimonas sp.]
MSDPRNKLNRAEKYDPSLANGNKISAENLSLDADVFSVNADKELTIRPDFLPDVVFAINASGGDYTEGTLVYISGIDATTKYPTIAKADADYPNRPAQYILRSAVANGGTSEIYQTHTLTGQNTNAATVGDPVYLDPTTAGGWTLTAPTAADQITQIIGWVEVKSATIGEIYFCLPGLVSAVGTSFYQPISITLPKIAVDAINDKVKIWNASGGDYAVGDIVYLNSYNAANNSFTAGIAYRRSLLTGLNTNAATVGDPVYLSDTVAGSWTLTKPSDADDIAQVIGRVKVKDIAAGIIDFLLPGDLEIIGTSAIQAISITNAKLAASAVTLPKVAVDEINDKVKIWNASGGDYAVGDIVYLNSYNAANNSFTAAKAQANTSATKAQYILKDIIANGASGIAYRRSLLTGLNTNAATVGDPVYLSDTVAGSWTLTKPTTAGTIAQVIGRVKVKDIAAGIIDFLLPGDLEFIGTSSAFSVNFTDLRRTGDCALILPNAGDNTNLGITTGASGAANISLTSSNPTGATKTEKARFQFIIPANYIAASDLTLTASARVAVALQVSATLDFTAFESNKELGVGADICATAAQSINTNVWANYAYTITGAALLPGDVIDIEMTIALDDTAGAHAGFGQIGNITITVPCV